MTSLGHTSVTYGNSDGHKSQDTGERSRRF